MEKFFSHLLLILINIPAVIINSYLVGIFAYSNHKLPVYIAPQYIICTFIFCFIWIIHGFNMGKNSRKDFLYFVCIYWSFVLGCLLLGNKLDDFTGNGYSIATIFGLFNLIPLYPIYVFMINLSVENIIEITFPFILIILLSFLGYFLGKWYKGSIDKEININ